MWVAGDKIVGIRRNSMVVRPKICGCNPKSSKLSDYIFAELPIVIARPSSVMGPGDRVSLPLYQTAQTGVKIIVTGAPRLLSIIDVSDLVEGLYCCAIKPVALRQTLRKILGSIHFGRTCNILSKPQF